MTLSRELQFEIAGAAVGLVLSYAITSLLVAAFGPWGKLALVISIPFGMLAGWTLVKLLLFARRILSETD
jgi:hypothetical protein